MPSIPWRPRIILPGRNFRLPVRATDDNIALTAEHFETIATRWCERDTARYYYLRSPQKQGDYTLIATHNGNTAETTIQVRTLNNLRQPHTYNGAQWPRRWPLGQNYHPTKTRQTLQDDPRPERLNQETIAWWSSQPDHVLWSQLPPAELPKAHFANCHQGCPNCGTAIFKYSGFYPWERNHLPCDFKSQCPNCASVYPSNNLTKGDYTSGKHADDGYGYFDAEGHIYLFHAPMNASVLERAAAFTNAPHIEEIQTTVQNKQHRAHSYRIEAAEQLGAHTHRLTLDVTSILGRAKVIAIEDNKIDFGFQIPAKSGNLHGTRLQTNDDWAVIANAHNPGSWPPGNHHH